MSPRAPPGNRARGSEWRLTVTVTMGGTAGLTADARGSNLRVCLDFRDFLRGRGIPAETGLRFGADLALRPSL